MMPHCSCTVIQLQQFLLSNRVSLICNSLITWATAASPGCVQWHGIDMIPESSLLHPHIRNASRRGAHLCASFLDTVVVAVNTCTGHLPRVPTKSHPSKLCSAQPRALQMAQRPRGEDATYGSLVLLATLERPRALP
jgi:hypothetical protein